MAQKIKYKSGDIFAIRASNGQYVFGRILLDIQKQCIDPGLVTDENPLEFIDGLLIEGYNLLKDEPIFEDSPILIKGYFIEDSAISDGTFKIIGYKKVYPEDVDFPGYFYVNPFNGKVSFERGEITIPLNISREEGNSYKLFGGVHFSESFDTVILTLMGRTDLTEEEAKLHFEDIRFVPKEKQQKINQIVGEDMTLPYYELAEKYGIDTSRFFIDQ